MSNTEIKKNLLQKIKNKSAIVAVIGLGYVGLPLAVEKAKAGYRTIGFDIQKSKVRMVNEGHNYIGDVVSEELEGLVKKRYIISYYRFFNSERCRFYSHMCSYSFG